jgi:hypothetical protein
LGDGHHRDLDARLLRQPRCRYGHAASDTYVTAPTAIANFRSNYADEGTVPREWAERVFRIARFTDMPVGGHFAAVEEPDLHAADIAEFFS